MIDTKKGKNKLKDNAKCIQNINGEWTGWLNFGNNRYWEKGEYDIANMYKLIYTLPSDSMFREDLKLYLKNNEKSAQEQKEKLEVLQRKDRKLRESYMI